MMRRTIVQLAALALSTSTASGQVLPMEPPQEADSSVATQEQFGRTILFSQQVGSVAQRYGFHGEFGMAVPTASVYGARPAKPGANYQPGPWRWASVAKQVTAILVMQEVASGRIALDQPVSRYLPSFASPNAATMTVRQLLMHQSGLPNTDRDDGAYHRPGYAGSRDPLNGFCAGPVAAQPGGNWSYNNCDYIVAGALLHAVTGKPWAQLVQERIAVPLKLKSLGVFPARQPTPPGVEGDRREPAYDFASYGAAGALYGSINDLLALDLALLSGELLPEPQLAELWDGKADLGYIALGQWSYTAQLKSCAKPIRIVERRGAIGAVQIRNFILPELETAVVAFTDRAEFDFGEIWQGSGFSHDLLGLASCPKEVP